MHRLICWSTMGFVAAVISIGAAGQKAKDDPAQPRAKAAPSKAPQPADAGQPGPDQRARDNTARQGGGKDAVGEPAKADQLPNKYADEERAILEAGISFVKAYADHDARRVAAHFASEAEFINDEGQELRGREEIEASLAQIFKEHPQASVAIDVESLRILSPVLAIETGTTTCRQDEKSAPDITRYTAVHTKSDGQWLVASVREEKLQGARVHSARVQQLDWLVGDWVDEDEASVVRFVCQMTESGNYLIRNFEVVVAGQKVLSGSQRTGWDPISGKLRAWTFDSDGGYFDGTWHRDGEKWILTSVGVTADGQSAAGTAIFTPVDGNTITWQAVDRQIDGVRLDDSDEFTLVRRGPQPQTADADENAAR